jgi:hypothetical protein
MKKIIFSLMLLIATSTCFAQKWSVDHFEVSQNGIATVYLVNDNGETKVVNIKAIVNPQYNTQGKTVGGATQNRQGLMLTPPIKPGGWEKNYYGDWVPVGFSYNMGFYTHTSTIYVIEGSYKADGKLRYDGREQVCNTNTHNPGNWVSQYSYNTFQIPNFYQVVTVSKNWEGQYVAQ